MAKVLLYSIFILCLLNLCYQQYVPLQRPSYPWPSTVPMRMPPQMPVQQRMTSSLCSPQMPLSLPPQQIGQSYPVMLPSQPMTRYNSQNNVLERIYFVPIWYPLPGSKGTSEQDKVTTTLKPTEKQPDDVVTPIPVKPNQCPPEEKRSCFKTSPYRACEQDWDCEGVQKCCFDFCLEKTVCKPPVYN